MAGIHSIEQLMWCQVISLKYTATKNYIIIMFQRIEYTKIKVKLYPKKEQKSTFCNEHLMQYSNSNFKCCGIWR